MEYFYIELESNFPYSVRAILFEHVIENVVDLVCSLICLIFARHQVTIHEHDRGVIQVEPCDNRSLVS